MGTRLFVGNIPSGVLEKDLTKEFSHYGKVVTVDLKQKHDGKNTNQFGFVTLEADNFNINKCIQEFSEQLWKGSYLNVSIAKESFLEKLKRERAEAEKPKEEKKLTVPASLTPVVNISRESYKINVERKEKNEEDKNTITYTPENDFKEFKTNNINKKEKYKSFKDEEYDHNESFQPKKRKNNIQVNLGLEKSIFSVSPEKSVSNQHDTEKQNTSLSNKKRLESIQNMKNTYNEKKSFIKQALSGVDCKKNNKIIFNDDDSASFENKVHNNIKRNSANGNISNNSKSALFDDESDDDTYNFEIKRQFEGETGRKLLELQSKYNSDKRFTLDERFLEDDTEMDIENEDIENSQTFKKNNADENNDDIDVMNEEEKLKQAEILKGIFGDSGNLNRSDNAKKLPLKTMLRFDPSRSDHTKFLNKAVEKPAVSKNKKKSKMKEESEVLNEKRRPEDTPAPVVSEERYYKMNEPLKQSGEDNEPFSLLSLFGNKNIEENETLNDDEYNTIPIEKSDKKIKNPLNGEKNPFFYDSSDSENEKVVKKEKKSDVKTELVNEENKPSAIIENLFFSDNDPRFLEGLEFFLSTKPILEKSRHELKSVVKKRIKNNMRNSNQFHSKKVARSSKTKFKRK